MPTSNIGHRYFAISQMCRHCGCTAGNQYEDSPCGNCQRNDWYRESTQTCYNCGCFTNTSVGGSCGSCGIFPWNERPTPTMQRYTCIDCGCDTNTNNIGGCGRCGHINYAPIATQPIPTTPLDQAISEALSLELPIKPKKKEEPSNISVEIPEKNFIDMIGIELEGGWDTMPAGEENHGDGSVYCKESKSVGEIASEPFKNVNDCLAWVDRCYPIEVNKTCGLHIHMSFVDKLSYMQLMNKTFYRYFLAECMKWGKTMKINSGSEFWKRLEGKNSYCRKQFNPDRQSTMRSKEGCRYTHLNYCFGLYGTLECRLFPMFKKKALVLEAIKFFYITCNTFLASQKGERVFRSKVEDTYEDIIIEEKLCVS